MNESGVVPAHAFKVLQIALGALFCQGFASVRTGVKVTADRGLDECSCRRCDVLHQGCLRRLPKLVHQPHSVGILAVEEHGRDESPDRYVTPRRELRSSMSEFDTP